MLDVLLNAVKTAASLGISVIPPAEDGTKRPYPGSREWKEFTERRPEPAELERWYGPKTGLGIVCGKISQGLELFEFDDGATYLRFKEIAEGLGGNEIIERIENGYLETTPGGGIHWFYYTDEIRGSAKLAIRPGKTLIETKGEGGFVIIAPSFGSVHPSGRAYVLKKGSLQTICRLSGAERDWLWDIARSLNEQPRKEPAAVIENRARRLKIDWPDITTPGDDFNSRERWDGILVGWRLLYTHGETQYWRRPGKSEGHSATVNYGGTNHLHVFSSSTEFEINTSYSKFAAYAVLNFKSDYKAAAKDLIQRGYGTHKRWVKGLSEWELRIFPNPCPKGERRAKPGDPKPDPNSVSQLKKSTSEEISTDDLASLSDEDLGLISATKIRATPIRWEWPNRIARGKLNLIAGEGGDGKSQISTAVVAAITSGGRFPDGTGPVEPGNCIILAAEDGASDTIKPRLIASGADCGRVIIATAQIRIKAKDGKMLVHPVSFQDLDYWRVAILRHTVRLIVADPIPAYLGRGVNDNRNSEIRAVLEPFVSLLDELGTAFMAITHLNKSAEQKSPTHRILGSVAYSNLARTVHCTYRDPEDEKRRIFAMVKSNIVEPQKALAFRIESFEYCEDDGEVIKTSKIHFETEGFEFSPTAHLAGQAQAQAKPGRPATTSVKDAEWLWDLLYDRQWTPLAQIIQLAGEADMCGPIKEDGRVTTTTRLYRARDKLADLTGDKEGFTVDECRMPYQGYGKSCVHWRVVSLNSPVPGYETPEIDDDSTPF